MIDSATKWIPKWVTNEEKTYDNKPVENLIEFEYLTKTLEPLEVVWNHVPSHQGNEGNAEANRLEREGIDRESSIIMPEVPEINKKVPGVSVSKPIVLHAPAPVFDSKSSEEENYTEPKDPSLTQDHEGLNRSDLKDE